MERKTIKCEKCGAEARFIPKRKLCGPCQIHRDIGKATSTPAGYHRKCNRCRQEFYPFRKAHKTCWRCLEPAENDKWPTCAKCGQRHRPAPGFEGTSRGCTNCVQKSANAQRGYVVALTKIIAANSR